MNAEKFIKDFHDHLAKKLDTYEQAIYLYIVRHSRLEGLDEIVIGFKSARKKFAFGIGKKGTALSEGVCYEKLKNLEEKKCIKIIGTEHLGTKIHVFLPDEINNVIPELSPTQTSSIDDMDFFNEPENRKLILDRENHHCFYCRKEINAKNYIVEHVISRPQGNNSYKNVVASCRQCNNRKGALLAEDFIRTLYREGFLTPPELEDRLSHIDRLRVGELKPNINR